MVVTEEARQLSERLKQYAKELGRKPTRDEFVSLPDVIRNQVKRIGFNNLVRLAGLPLHPNQKISDIEVFEPVIIILDIEVAPLKLWSYGIRDQYHGLEAIDEDWTLLSFAAKELNSEQITFHSVDPLNPRDDEKVAREAFFILNRADIVICHNAAFDVKMLQARFLKYNFPVCRPFRRICTYQIAKKHFRLTSNKLEYVAKYLGVIEKLDHAKFPGMKLFKECAKGNIEAFRELEDYNIRDIITTEAVYLKLRKYDSSIRFNVFYQDNRCDCGSSEMRKLEPTVTNVGAFRVYQCVECGKVYKEKQNMIDKNIRKHLLT